MTSHPKPPDFLGMDPKVAKTLVRGHVHDLEKEVNSREKVCKLRTNFEGNTVRVWYRPYGTDKNIIGGQVDINDFVNEPEAAKGSLLRQIQAAMKRFLAKPNVVDEKFTGDKP